MLLHNITNLGGQKYNKGNSNVMQASNYVQMGKLLTICHNGDTIWPSLTALKTLINVCGTGPCAGNRVDVNKISIRHFRVGSMFNRHRCDGLRYLGNGQLCGTYMTSSCKGHNDPTSHGPKYTIIVIKFTACWSTCQKNEYKRRKWIRSLIFPAETFSKSLDGSWRLAGK